MSVWLKDKLLFDQLLLLLRTLFQTLNRLHTIRNTNYSHIRALQDGVHHIDEPLGTLTLAQIVDLVDDE